MKMSSRILLFALCTTLFCATVLLLLMYMGISNNSLTFILLTIFLIFVVSFIAHYVFYFVFINRNVNSINKKIKDTFLARQIPQKYDQLEDEDAILKLNQQIDYFIEERNKEVNYFENLDSYRKEYLGNVSHELKTPVFNIQGYIDTLLNGGLEDETINKDYLIKADKSIDRLINIIDDLETITQLEAGNLDLEIDTFDIAALCKDIYAALEMNASKKNIHLLLDAKYDKPIYVNADKYRIRQVFVNLVTNSIKYGKENGNTVIKFSYFNNDVIVEISDDGTGIDKNHLPRIFERFYRVDKGRSREQGGTGLGLAIVKHIIEAHKKSIKVESEIGAGTKFTFSLNSNI